MHPGDPAVGDIVPDDLRLLVDGGDEAPAGHVHELLVAHPNGPVDRPAADGKQRKARLHLVGPGRTNRKARDDRAVIRQGRCAIGERHRDRRFAVALDRDRNLMIHRRAHADDRQARLRVLVRPVRDRTLLAAVIHLDRRGDRPVRLEIHHGDQGHPFIGGFFDPGRFDEGNHDFLSLKTRFGQFERRRPP